MKKQIIRYFSFLCFIIVCCFENTKAQTYNFRSFSVKDGLLQSTVKSITQDKEGYIWFATDGGISRFDGLHFTNFTKNEGLPDASATALFCDKNGNLWIGFTTGKLCIYRNNQFEEVIFKGNIQPKRIIRICSDYNDNIWISTENAGAIVFNKGDVANYKNFSLEHGLSDWVIQVVPLKNKSEILFLTDLGLKKGEIEKEKFEYIKHPELPVYNYSSAAEDQDGNLWLGSMDKGVIIFNQKKQTTEFYSLKHNLPIDVIGDITIDHKNKTWISIWKNGIVEAEINKKPILLNSTNGMPTDRIWNIFQDKEKNIWFGLQDKGVCSFRGKLIAHYNLQNGLRNEVINDVEKGFNEEIWLATNEGISVINPEKKDKQKVMNISISDEMQNELVTSLCKKGKSIFAAVFRSGILEIDAGSKQIIRSKILKRNLINVLKVDNTGKIWVGGNDGLTILDSDFEQDKSHLFNSDFFSEKQITEIYFHKNLVYVGTRGSGLYEISGRKITQIGKRNGLDHPNANSIAFSKKHGILIGSEGGGLYSLKNNKAIKISDRYNFKSDYITLVEVNNEKIWVGTNIGVYLIKDNKAILFSKNEGFTEMETKSNSSYCDDSGKVWFGTINGATAFDFNEFITNTFPPSVKFTTFSIYNEHFDYSKNVSLNYKQNEIAFKFKSISFTIPENVIYKYKLVGTSFKQDWHFTKQNGMATYTSLPPGNYKFYLTAANNDGIWNNTPIVYEFSINPPFWKTVWFYIVIVLALVITIGVYIRFRTIKLIRDKQILEKQVKERTWEIEMKNDELLRFNTIIQQKNKEITDSIIYAQHIQNAIQPSEDRFNEAFPDSFVLYKPKDIVSGDFYWFCDITDDENTNSPFDTQSEDKILQEIKTNELKNTTNPEEAKLVLALADCTGHGVPGAFMCLVGNSLLNQIINLKKIFEPSSILDLLHEGVIAMLKQKETDTKDGMDIAICFIDRKENKLKYSGALRPAYLFRKKNNTGNPLVDYETELFSPDKFTIGGRVTDENEKYKTHETQINKGDILYLFSDGYPDQFGGEKGKKITTKKFRDFVHSILNHSMKDQKKLLNNFFENWKGNDEQIDDVIVIGIKY